MIDLLCSAMMHSVLAGKLANTVNFLRLRTARMLCMLCVMSSSNRSKRARFNELEDLVSNRFRALPSVHESSRVDNIPFLCFPNFDDERGDCPVKGKAAIHGTALACVPYQFHHLWMFSLTVQELGEQRYNVIPIHRILAV